MSVHPGCIEADSDIAPDFEPSTDLEPTCPIIIEPSISTTATQIPDCHLESGLVHQESKLWLFDKKIGERGLIKTVLSVPACVPCTLKCHKPNLCISSGYYRCDWPGVRNSSTCIQCLSGLLRWRLWAFQVLLDPSNKQRFVCLKRWVGYITTLVTHPTHTEWFLRRFLWVLS